MENNNCGGSGPHTAGEVRLLPLGSNPHHGNLILCRSCFSHEISYRRGRNHALAEDCKFKLPGWEECKVYGEPGVEETPVTKHAREVMDFVGRHLHLTPEERSKRL